jgi:hypothetical protein
MDEQVDEESYAATFRHEVGHAVDEELGGTSENFRRGQAGWNQYDSIDDFIDAMGGYGSLPEHLHGRLKKAIERYIGPGGTFAAPTPTFGQTMGQVIMEAYPDITEFDEDGSDPLSKEVRAFREASESCPPIEVMRACEGDRNYLRFDQWKIISGRAFFVNHYYAAPYSVNAATIKDLKSWPDASSAQSAAFSDWEWFAETYAVWYGTSVPGGDRDWPSFVHKFFKKVVANVGGPGQAPSSAGSYPKVSS